MITSRRSQRDTVVFSSAKVLDETKAPRVWMWAVPYGSSLYKKINWWSGFLLSKYIDPEKIREGESFLTGTESFIPSKWTFVYSRTPKGSQGLHKLRKAWEDLGAPPLKIYYESTTEFKALQEIFTDVRSPREVRFHRALDFHE